MTPEELTPEQVAALEGNTRRALAGPIPPDLREAIADLIEPHTLNMGLHHGEVMDCIGVAWPVIRGWLREHPGWLRDPGGGA